MEQIIEVNIGASPVPKSCKINSPKLKEPMFKRFVEDLNKDRKKDMTFFYNNLDTLEIKYIPPYKGICYDAAAQYSMDKNIIEVVCGDRVDTFIDHELLHMASSTIDEYGNIYSGFIQARGELGIGYGLDEGYTSLLDDRYFLNRTEEKPQRNKETYCVVKYIAKLVEEFVGQDKMENLYFSANLLELIEFLAPYTSVEQSTQFIHDIDEILIGFEQKRFKRFFLCLRKFAECSRFMAEAWYARVTEGYIDGKLSDEEYKACLEDIKKMLSNRLKLVHFPIRSKSNSKYYKVIKSRVDKKLMEHYKQLMLDELVKEGKIPNTEEAKQEEYKKLDKRLYKMYGKRKDTIDTN